MTDDILAQVCRARRLRLVIGFAAETENIETGAAEKLASARLRYRRRQPRG